MDLRKKDDLNMDFAKFKTEQELMEETGLTPEQALRIINQDIRELKRGI